MTLGTIGGGKLDMELAGAGNTEVIRAKKSIIDQHKLDERIQDILVTLGSQYHLIRVFHQNDNVFTYVVLDRKKANLALARMQLEQVDCTEAVVSFLRNDFLSNDKRPLSVDAQEPHLSW